MAEAVTLTTKDGLKTNTTERKRENTKKEKFVQEVQLRLGSGCAWAELDTC